MRDEKKSETRPEADIAYWLPAKPDADPRVLRIDFVDGHPAPAGEPS